MELLKPNFEFVTYAHYRNDNNKIFYIGKGKKYRPFDTYGRSNYWKNVAQKYGHTVKILAYWNSEKEAYEHEKLLISCLKEMNFPLVNFSTGGEGGATGVTRSQKFKENVSKRMKNKISSKETKEKISNSKKGKKIPKLAGELNPAKSLQSRLKRSIAMKMFYANGGINSMKGKKRPDLAERNRNRHKKPNTLEKENYV